MSTATALMTAEEFEARYANGPPCELVRGEVVELVPAGYPHSRITIRASYVIESGEADWPRPDLRWGSRVRYGAGARHGPWGRRRLLLVRATAGWARAVRLQQDRAGSSLRWWGGQGWDSMLEKTAEHLAMGVNRVWVLDPQAESVHVFGGDLAPAEYHGDDPVTDEAVLPGFVCRVRQFFHD